MEFQNLVLMLIMFTMSLTMVASTTRNVRGNETDRLALLAIKAQIIYDPFQITTSWNDSLHFCQWKGVSCGRRHNQRVTRLNLRSNKLEGQISPSITNLSFIRVISLSNNSFRGEIPPEMSRLFRLQTLSLHNNSLSGKIPQNLSFCSDLRVINLDGNNLTGKIPAELGLLSSLTELRVYDNKLDGNIPSNLGNISTLRNLDLAANRFEGQIPETLGQLKSLSVLQITGNMLTGAVPRSVFNLSELSVFIATKNQLKGELPRDIGITLPSLEWFVIWGNNFRGTIPLSFANSSNLYFLELASNRFHGGVPKIFGNLQRLEYLVLEYNNLGSGEPNDLDFFWSFSNSTSLRVIDLVSCNLGGKLPNSVANFSNQFEDILLEQNLISGTIPRDIGNFVNLRSFTIFSNLLTGTIPTSIGSLNRLQKIGLDNNQISGEIPYSLGNMSSLSQIWLGHNSLSGNIPSNLGKRTNLNSLDLSSNTLNGTIPESVISMSSLSLVLNLSRNQLVGSLPAEVGKLVNLDGLDISHNRLSNIIPPSIGSCTILRKLLMDHNMFEGSIPNSLSSLRGIEEIDLSHNNLSGEIPKEISGLAYLSKLDLSYNNLEGEIPTGLIFRNTSAISVLGNPKLCGGIPQLRLKECAKKKVKKQSSFRGWKMIIFIVFGVMAISLFIYFLFSWWFKKQRKQLNESSLDNPFATISYGDLLKATDGFSLENLIGVGSIGSVYKGILEADQTAVAVKVFNLQKRGASKSFAAECETLRGIRHRNLVKIITACSSIDYRGNEFKALVYELMPNGNLENLLHPSQQTEDSNNDALTLSKRVDIAIDVASAVDYLHNHVETPILHCDLKPSNILLDHENVAHVGDFGLSRIVPQVNTEISNNQSSSSGLKGTIGYAAPEYGMGSKVSKEGDMYSFGILLLEIFTGKRPTDSDFGEGMNLNQFVKSALPERVMEIIDQGIIPREDDEASSNSTDQEIINMKILECCVSVLKIGVICSDEFPRSRMKIDEALKELYAAKKKLL